jgi:hypothetical protein
MKVKIFETNYGNRSAKSLEVSINEWLESEKPSIIQVLQSDTRGAKPSGGLSDFYLTITFLYD